MFPRFCKLCFIVADESLIKLRRFSVKHSNVTSEYYDNEQSQNDEEERIENEEVLEKPQQRKCIIKCKRTEFNYYEGDTFSKFEAMPLASRGWHHRNSKGDYFTIHPTDTLPEEDIDVSLSFEDLNLNEQLIANLENFNIVNPTSIQKYSIPKILESQNVVMTAETGSGKTFAFLIPLVEKILKWKPLEDRGCNRPLGLIITPSKELTLQIARELKKLTANLDINIVKLVGGKTAKIIKNPPVGEVDVVVASLGVINKLVTNGIYKTEKIKYVVLDEADTLFDDTFSSDVTRLLRKIPIGAGRDPNEAYPKTAQLILNSATIPQNLPQTLENVVDSNSLVPITTGSEHQISVPQKFLRLGSSEKPMTLLKFVKPKVKTKTPIIIFSNTTKACDFTSIFLKQFNINCINLHSDMNREQRKGRYNEFQSGRCTILTTTDSGSRGLDTTIAKEVINFDFPLITSEYIHRCGRIGRIGSPKDCRVINFISRPLEIILTSKIEFAIRRGKSIPMIDLLHKGEDDEEEYLKSMREHKIDQTEQNSKEDNEDSDYTKKELPLTIPQ